MNWQKIKQVGLSVGSLIGLIFLIVQAYYSLPSFNKISWSFSSWLLILGSVVLMCGAIGLQITNFTQIANLFTNGVRFANIANGYTFSMLSKYIPGGIWGYLGRGIWLEKKHTLSIKDSTKCSLIEIFISIETAIVVSILGLSILMPTISIWIGGLVSILVIILVWLITNVFLKILGGSKSNPIQTPIQIPITKWFILNSVAIAQWLLLGFAAKLIFLFIPIDQTIEISQGFVTLVFLVAFATSWVVGFIIFFIPGGIGIREAVLSIMIIAFISIPMAAATTISVFTRLLFTISELIWLMIGKLVFRKY